MATRTALGEGRGGKNECGNANDKCPNPIDAHRLPGISRQSIVDHIVMAGFIPAIHVFHRAPENQTWMAGTSPAMTETYLQHCKKMPGLAAGRSVLGE
jgi:hypothetical protein